MPPRKKTEAVTDPKTILEDGGTPNAPATDEPDGDQEQTTEEHGNKDAVLTPDQLELEELRAQLAELRAQQEQAESKVVDHKPIPEDQLTPEQREIRNLKDQLARRNGKDDRVEEHFENSEGGIVVHFIADGLTSNNRVFYRGQEVTFGPEAYKQTQDRFGVSWLDLTEEEQYERFKEVKFRRGPWPGKRQYEEESLKNTSISEQAPVISI